MNSSAYNAGLQNPMKRTPPAARLSEDYLLEQFQTWAKVQARVKSLQRNNWLSSATYETMQDFLCSRGGMKPFGMPDRSQKIFTGWSSGYVDIAGVDRWTDVQRRIVSGCVSGDILIRTVIDDKKKGIQTRVQLIDGSLVETPSDKKNDKSLKLGVKYDSEGREKGYWVRIADDTDTSQDSSAYEFISRYDEQGHEVAVLLRNPDLGMIRSSRGLSMFIAVMAELEDIAQLATSGVRGGITKNLLGMVMTTGRPTAVNAALARTNDDGTPREIIGANGSLAKQGAIPDGSITTLPVDDGDLKEINHSGNVYMVALQDSAIRNFCAGVGIPMEILVSRFLGINFSSGKLSFDKFFRKLDRWTETISKALDMIRRSVIFEGLLIQGIVPTAADMSVTGWIGAPRPDIDPTKSATADDTRLANGTTSHSLIVMERLGMTYRQLLEINQQDKLLQEEFGVIIAPAEKKEIIKEELEDENSAN